MGNAKKKVVAKVTQSETMKKIMGGQDKNITGSGSKSLPQKGALNPKRLEEQKHKGANHGSTMGAFVAEQRRKLTGIRNDLKDLRNKKSKTKADLANIKRLEREVDKMNSGEVLASQLKRQAAVSAKKKAKVTLPSLAMAGGGDTSKGKDLTKKQFLALSDKELSKMNPQKMAELLMKFKLFNIDMAKGGMSMKKKGMAKGGAMMKKKGMARGGMKTKGYAMGGLKKPAATQSGLKKLPSSVRNKMGYAKKGGMMKKKGMAKGGMKKKGYAKGGMAKSYGIVDNRKKK